MLLSRNYALKAWTTHERKSAQARAFKEKREYILPVRIDNTEIPGIKDTVGHVSLVEKTPNQIANLVKKKLDALIEN